MTQLTMRARTISLDDSWDVIVIGGGPSGCAAAAASAREGARTLLLEANGALGGMGTLGLVPFFCGYADGEKVIARGIAEHVRKTLCEQTPHLRREEARGPIFWPAIDPERLKRIYDDLVTSAGVDVLFHSQLVAVDETMDGVVGALIVGNKTGLSAYRAPVYVDCTGDGDLATWAGASFEKGDAQGNLQPATHCFVLSNVDEYGLNAGPDVHFFDPDSPVHKAIRSEKYPLIVDLHSCSSQVGPRSFGYNTGHVYGIDNTNPHSVSQGLLQGRQQAEQYRAAFAEFHPAFANAYLAATGALLGVRETRRILGDYFLTQDDYLARRSFPDEICRNAYNIDIHDSSVSSDQTGDIAEIKQNIEAEIKQYANGESFGVPYRCLTPRDLKNVLVAGRCISTDRAVNGSVRIMACCLTTGEAAGLAAALTARADAHDIHRVDTDHLRVRLRAHGAYLP